MVDLKTARYTLFNNEIATSQFINSSGVFCRLIFRLVKQANRDHRFYREKNRKSNKEINFLACGIVEMWIQYWMQQQVSKHDFYTSQQHKRMAYIVNVFLFYPNQDDDDYEWTNEEEAIQLQ